MTTGFGIVPVVAMSVIFAVLAIGMWGAPWWMGALWITAAAPAVINLHDKQRLLLVGIALAAALAGGWRFFQWDGREPPTLIQYVGMTVTMEGEIASAPDPGLTITRYKFDAGTVMKDGVQHAVAGSVLLTLSQFADFEVGTNLKLVAKLDEPPVFAGFDYRSYLARHDIVATVLFPEVEVIAAAPRWDPARIAEATRQQLQQSLDRSLQEPEAALAAGLVLGREGNLSNERLEDFRIAGLAHLVAVSGAHLALIVASTVLVTRSFMSKRASMAVGAFSLLPYVLIAGTEPNVMRAFVMALVLLVTYFIERPHLGLHVLAFAAVALVAWRPEWAVDVGFQLSVAATAGIIAFQPWLRWFAEIALRRVHLRPLIPAVVLDVLAVSGAASVATAPIVWVTFGRISLVGPLVNVAVAPLFLAAFWLSIATAAAGVIWGPLGWGVGLLAHYPLAGLLWASGTAADIPHAAVSVDTGNNEAAVLAYGVLGLLALAAYRYFPPATRVQRVSEEGRRVRWSVGGAIVAVTLGLAYTISLAPLGGPNELRVQFLDIGQGDAILVTTPSGHRVLVDGGPSGLRLMRELGEVLPHWERTIDTVVLTHPQQDHIAGLPELFERFDVGQVLDTGIERSTAAFLAYAEVAQERDVIGQGWTFTEDGVSFEVLWPANDLPPHVPDDALNDTSMVLLVTYGDISFLLTGDIEDEAAEALMGLRVSADVLKVPHHGSRTTPLDFLTSVGSQVAIISVGEGNPFGHPVESVLSALSFSSVYRTDVHGRVTVSSDGTDIRVTTER